jgi:hypothetical protein
MEELIMARNQSPALKLKIVFLILASMLVSSVNAHAALTRNDVSMLYVSIFNRASEGEGNTYWGNRPDLQTMAATASAMLETDAAKNYFGSSLNSNQDFIEHIYLNTLNKTYWDDPMGITYWVNQLNEGKTRGEVVAELVGVIKDYAPGGPNYDPTDQATIDAYNQFNNRVTVSNYMAETVQNTPDNWETVTQFGPGGLNVTFATTSVDTARQAIDIFNGSPASLEDDIEYYMAMVTSAGDLSPVMDEISVLLSTILSGDTSVVSITPPLQNIDLNNLPPSINITANFGSGYTPEGSTAVYTGMTVIDITNIAFTQTGINANASLNATDVRRDGTLVLNGLMTMGINAGMSGENISLNANINFSNLTTLDAQVNGGITLNIPGISGEGQLLQPVTITLNQFSTLDYQMNGTVTMTQVSADAFDINFNVTTNQGPVSGILRAQMDVANPDQIILSTPSGPLSVEDATLVVNQVIMDTGENSPCSDLPVSGNIVVTKGAETGTITFSNCAYTVN